MKPFLALLLFAASTTLFYFQPTPDPSKHLPASEITKSQSPLDKYDLEVFYVTDPNEVNIP